MKPSPLRHPVAVLRQIIGLGQKELAALVGRAPRTIQAVELEQIKLGADLAEAIVRETGADLSWLVRGDVTKPAIDRWGNPYEKDAFNETQGRKIIGWKSDKIRTHQEACVDTFGQLGSLFRFLVEANLAGKEAKAIGLLWRLEDAVIKLLPHSKDNLESWGLMNKFICASVAELHLPNGSVARMEFSTDGSTLPIKITEPAETPPPSPKPRAPRSRKAGAPPPNRAQ